MARTNTKIIDTYLYTLTGAFHSAQICLFLILVFLYRLFLLLLLFSSKLLGHWPMVCTNLIKIQTFTKNNNLIHQWSAYELTVQYEYNVLAFYNLCIFTSLIYKINTYLGFHSNKYLNIDVLYDCTRTVNKWTN
jgi:hypothetical protein